MYLFICLYAQHKLFSQVERLSLLIAKSAHGEGPNKIERRYIVFVVEEYASGLAIVLLPLVKTEAVMMIYFFNIATSAIIKMYIKNINSLITQLLRARVFYYYFKIGTFVTTMFAITLNSYPYLF